MISYRLYAITDRAWLNENETLAEAVENAILGGATIVQLREKELDYESFRSLAIEVMEVCRNYNVPFIINDNVMLARDIDADGVHLGQSDMSIEEAREILGFEKIIGVTAKTISQAIEAERKDASYIGSGAVFGSDTKSDATTMDLDLLERINDSVSIPVVAIGGINSYNVAKLHHINLGGVAVVSGIFARNNKTKASRDILANCYGRPIIQCITNHVTVNEVANMVLNFGASPIMSHNKNEVVSVQKGATGLLVNLGATDDYDAIKKAYKCAIEQKHVIVIDPVGVSGIRYRRDFLMELLDIGKPTCIRGNVAEILSIYTGKNTSKGLDSSYIKTDMRDVTLALARKLNTIIVASGVTDIVSNGLEINEIESGHMMQKNLTGSGCMLSAAICSALAVSSINYADINNKNMTIVNSVCSEMGDAAKRAAEYVIDNDLGIYSFQTKWFDELV